jgi:hypothetical protein
LQSIELFVRVRNEVGFNIGSAMKSFSEDVNFFQRDFLDPEMPISRIGTGEVGGKARGLIYIRNELHRTLHQMEDIRIPVEIPSFVVLCTDVFETFMQRNGLYDIVNEQESDDRITSLFQQAELPFEVLGDLMALVQDVRVPLAIRSSSLLEDQMEQPFAGVYATKMTPNDCFDPSLRFTRLAEAIKFVYASTYFRSARDYRLAAGYQDSDEKMAVIIQRLVGKRYHHLFYPEMSGVIRSFNYYPFGPAQPDQGVVSLALGLGKTIVDGDLSWTYSPAHPKIGPPFGSPVETLKRTQTEYWAVNLDDEGICDPMVETEFMVKKDLVQAERDGVLENLVSTYNIYSGRFNIGMPFPGPRVLTFAPLLSLDTSTFNQLILCLLDLCEKAYGGPVEIEFAMTFDPPKLGFLQVRRMATFEGEVAIDENHFSGSNILVSTDQALGNGTIDCIQDIIYTRPDTFSLRDTKKMVPELEIMNTGMVTENKPYLLIALGRLGTTDPWLGIPIAWGSISGAKVVVEATKDQVVVDLSQGSHYFHNIINLGIKYFLLSRQGQNYIDWDWLEGIEALEETDYIRHVRLPEPLQVVVDGLNRRGVIYKHE